MKEFTIDPYNLDYEGTFETVQLARWCYRFFCVDFLKDSKGGAAAWRSLKDGGDKWPVLKDLADSTEDPKAVKAWIAAVLAPMIRKENQRNYEQILDHADAADQGKVRTKKQAALILDVLADECFYWMIVGGRPDEMLNDAANLPPVIQDVLHDRMERQKNNINAFKPAEVTPLWKFIEKEATKGLKYVKYLESPATNITAVTKKKAIQEPTGAVKFLTSYGTLTLDKYDSDVFLLGPNLDKLFTYFCAQLAKQLPHYVYGKEGRGGKPVRIKGPDDLTDAQKGEIAAHRSIEISVSKYQADTGKDIKDVRREMRGAAFTLNDGNMIVNVDGHTYYWHIGGGLELGANDGTETDEELLSSVPAMVRQYAELTGNRAIDPIRNGVLRFTFDQSFAEYLATKYIPSIHADAWKLDGGRYPHAWHILKHLSECYNTETVLGHSKTAHRIKVSSLLAACPDMPTEQQVKEKGARRYTQLIVDPFELNLDELENRNFIRWHYITPDGETMNSVQRAESKVKYQDWKEWLIWYELIDYDDESQKAFAAKLKLAQDRKTKKANKKK